MGVPLEGRTLTVAGLRQRSQRRSITSVLAAALAFCVNLRTAGPSVSHRRQRDATALPLYSDGVRGGGHPPYQGILLGPRRRKRAVGRGNAGSREQDHIPRSGKALARPGCVFISARRSSSPTSLAEVIRMGS